MEQITKYHKSQDLYQLIAQATNDGIWDWNVPDNKIWVNESFCKTFGYDPSCLDDFYNEWLRRIHPSDRNIFLDSILAAQQECKPTWSGTFRFLLAGGEYGNIFQRVYFIYSPDQIVERVVGIVLNITEFKKEEQLIRISEEKFSKAFRSSPVPVSLFRKSDLSVVDGNHAFITLLGYSMDELVQKTVYHLVNSEKAFQSVLNILDTLDYIENRELQLRRKDNKIITVLFSAQPIQVDQEVYLLSTYQDITARKKAEEQLKINEKQLQLIYDTTTDIIYLLEVDDDQYRFISINKAFITATGLLSEQVIGKDVRQVIPEPSLYLVLENYRLAKECRKTIYWEETSLYPSGVKTGIVSITPVYNEEGQCFRLVGSVHDITEQKKVQDLMLKEKHLADSIIKSLPGVFCLFNEKGILLRWNENMELITGYSTEELKKMHPLSFFDEEQKDLITEKIREIFERGQADIETTMRIKNGKKIPFYFSGHAILFEDSPCIIGTAIDISERKKAEEALQHSYNEIRLLVSHLEVVREEERATLSREIHDHLGQLLTGLKMELAWLKKIRNLKEEEIIKRVNEASGLLDQCIQSVRSISATLRPSLLDDLGLADALSWQSEEFQKRYSIEVSFESQLKNIEISSSLTILFFRIYQEALTNVARHAKASKVTAQLYIDSDYLTLMIMDNGKGFDQQGIQKKRTLGILGMQERMAMANGTFIIRSYPGKGTKIIITAPLRSV